MRRHLCNLGAEGIGDALLGRGVTCRNTATSASTIRWSKSARSRGRACCWILCLVNYAHMMESLGGGLTLTVPTSRKLTDCETWIAQSAGSRGITYGCLQRLRGFNDTFTSSVCTLQKVLSEYAVHKSRSLSAPFDRAHRIFSELKSAPLCTSSFPG